MGKEPPEGLELATFKNWLDTRPKMETHEPNVYPTILGGVSRGFWSPFKDLGARSAIFWHLKTGTFALLTSGLVTICTILLSAQQDVGHSTWRLLRERVFVDVELFPPCELPISVSYQ